MSIITLTTDFGYHDSYVAEMKGAMLGINPEVRLVDVSHGIRAQNLHEAAFSIFRAYTYFPTGTVHVVVVDPGVGSGRRILMVKTAKHFFVAPDNGVLTYILNAEKEVVVREVTNTGFFLDGVSDTFEGRDKMAPVAAHLTKTDIFADIGNIVDMPYRFIIDSPVVVSNQIVGAVIYCDHFGNIVTNITRQIIGGAKITDVCVNRRHISHFSRTYSDVSAGDLAVMYGSSGFLEIAQNGGSAQQKIGAQLGSKVHLKVAN